MLSVVLVLAPLRLILAPDIPVLLLSITWAIIVIVVFISDVAGTEPNNIACATAGGAIQVIVAVFVTVPDVKV